MKEFALFVAGMCFLALLMIHLLGKRALGEPGPFDLVITSISFNVNELTQSEIFACQAPVVEDDKPKITDRLEKIEEQRREISALLQGHTTPEL